MILCMYMYHIIGIGGVRNLAREGKPIWFGFGSIPFLILCTHSDLKSFPAITSIEAYLKDGNEPDLS